MRQLPKPLTPITFKFGLSLRPTKLVWSRNACSAIVRTCFPSVRLVLTLSVFPVPNTWVPTLVTAYFLNYNFRLTSVVWSIKQLSTAVKFLAIHSLSIAVNDCVSQAVGGEIIIRLSFAILPFSPRSPIKTGNPTSNIECASLAIIKLIYSAWNF